MISCTPLWSDTDSEDELEVFQIDSDSGAELEVIQIDSDSEDDHWLVPLWLVGPAWRHRIRVAGARATSDHICVFWLVPLRHALLINKRTLYRQAYCTLITKQNTMEHSEAQLIENTTEHDEVGSSTWEATKCSM